MAKRSFSAKTVSPSTDNQVAIIQITDEQETRIAQLAGEWLKARGSVALKRRKYIVTDNEAVTDDASDYIKNNILHIRR